MLPVYENPHKHPVSYIAVTFALNETLEAGELWFFIYQHCALLTILEIILQGFIFVFGTITKHFPLTSFPSWIKRLMVINKVAELSSTHGNKTTQHFLPNCFKNTKAWNLLSAKHSLFIGTKAGKVPDSS